MTMPRFRGWDALQRVKTGGQGVDMGRTNKPATGHLSMNYYNEIDNAAFINAVENKVRQPVMTKR